MFVFVLSFNHQKRETLTQSGLRSSALFLAQVVSDLDPVAAKDRDDKTRTNVKKGHGHIVLFLKDLIQPFMGAIFEIFGIPSSISSFQDAETISFDAMQLSTQGAERQRKGVPSPVVSTCFLVFLLNVCFADVLRS